MAAIVAVIFLRAPRAAALTDRDVILLADLENKTGDPVFDDTLKTMLAAQLEQSPFFNLLPEERIREQLRYMQRSPDQRVTGEVAREVCQRAGTKAVLGGFIAALGSHYVIALDAVDCNTGRSLAREQREAGSKEQVLSELGKAASAMRQKLGESLASLQRFDKPIEATTSSLEALRAYTEANKQRFAGKYRESIPLYQRAIDLDPGFATAYEDLGVAYNNLLQVQLEKRAFAKAFELRDRVSEWERIEIEIRYYGVVLGDSQKALETTELWKQLYPQQYDANSLGNYLVDFGRFEDALAEYQEAVRRRPENVGPRMNLAHTYIVLNRLDEAKAICAKVVQDGFDTARTHQELFLLAFLKGDLEGMRRETVWASGRRGTHRVIFIQSLAELSSGKLTQSRQLIKEAGDAARREESADAAVLYLSNHALGEVLYGNDAAVIRVKDFTKVSVPHVLGWTAIMLAWAGDDSYKKIAADLHQQFARDTFVNSIWLPAALAVSEMRSGNAGKALELLKAAKTYEPAAESLLAIYLRGLAYLELKSGPDAAAEFRKILDHRGVAMMLFPELYPLSHLGAGRAYALMNDLPKARQSYENFFAIWKDADADLPVLIQAKREYAKLPAS